MEPVLTPDLMCTPFSFRPPVLCFWCVSITLSMNLCVNASRVRAASPVAVAACATPCIFRCHPPPARTRDTSLVVICLISLLSAVSCLHSGVWCLVRLCAHVSALYGVGPWQTLCRLSSARPQCICTALRTNPCCPCVWRASGQWGRVTNGYQTQYCTPARPALKYTRL